MPKKEGKSGGGIWRTIAVDGHQGIETESKLFIVLDGRERHRRRVHFNKGDPLYVLCFDAVPFSRWDQVKDGFQSILDSIKLEKWDNQEKAPSIRKETSTG